MRRTHPRWGARRITFELGQSGVASPPSRATVHRILVRNGLVRAQQQQHRRKYRRWQREAPMHLWQLDLVGGVFLADGRECKMLTGIDDHSRFVVIAAVLAVPSGRAVADAFLTAMRVLRCALGSADRQRQAVHRPVHQTQAGGGAVRAGLPGERHHRPADQAALADHDRQDRALASDAAPRTPRSCRPVRGPALGAGRHQRLGARLQPRPATPVAGHGDPGEPVSAQRPTRTPGAHRAPGAPGSRPQPTQSRNRHDGYQRRRQRVGAAALGRCGRVRHRHRRQRAARRSCHRCSASAWVRGTAASARTSGSTSTPSTSSSTAS